jgi:hypothetical protein
MKLLGLPFDEDDLALSEDTLTSTYFYFNGQYYEQTDGVVTGSLLSPVIANFFMEDFEKQAIELTTHKPVCCHRYVDDTYLIWPHGQTKLLELLDHHNELHKNIRSTMENEKDGHLPFLDIDIYGRVDGNLRHNVYRAPTHTNL